MLRRFTTAIAFLTRIPINPVVPHTGEDVAKSSIFFPWVACLLAAFQVLTMLGLSALSVPIILQAIAATTVLMLVGGGLHQDGLADMADGFGGGFTKERVLTIMRDSTIGTYGALALLLSLATRITALAALMVEPSGALWVFTAAALSRCSICLGWLMPYARDTQGTGQSLTQVTGPVEVLGAIVFALLLATVCVGVGALPALLLAGLVFSLMAWLCWRKIGGVTGDTLGATTEVSEVMLLALGAAWVSV